MEESDMQMVVDMLAAHTRASVTGERWILVSMTETFRASK
jgi:hypothetical protein